ncbi:MAG: lipid II flippase MurJ [Elusimicrobiota bacterium]
MGKTLSVNKTIAVASISLVIVSIFTNLISLLKEVIVAKCFGIGVSMDSYYSALTVPTMAGGIILSTFSIVFIPMLIKSLDDGINNSNKIASTAMNYFVVIFLGISLITFVFSEQIIRILFSGLSENIIWPAARILKILSLMLVFMGFSGILTSVLNAYKIFFYPAVSQIMITIGIIASVVLFQKGHNIYAIVWGYTAGIILQTFVLMYILKKMGFRYTFSFETKYFKGNKLGKNILTFMIISVAPSIVILINRNMAAFLPAGSITALTYAEKIVQMPLTVFISSLPVVLYTYFSIQVSNNKIEELRNTLALSIRMAAFVFIPIAVMIAFFSKQIVSILFQRGNFTAEATEVTSKILFFYAFQLFSYYAAIIFSKLLFILNEYSRILKIIAISIVLTVVGNILFIRLLNPPAAGIALSSSCNILIIAVMFFVALKKSIGNIHGLEILKDVLKIAVFATISGFTAVITMRFLNSWNEGIIIYKILATSLSVLTGLAVYISLSLLFKLEEVYKIYNLVRDKILQTVQ